MTLSRWLRDYLYVPLGGNRKGPTRTQANLMLTMLLGGLWHGASWNFVIWGAIHGFWLVIERIVLARIPAWKSDAIPMVMMRWFVTFHVVCFAWIFFRAPDLATSMAVLGKLGSLFAGDANFAPFHILVVALVALLMMHLAGARYALKQRIGEGPIWLHSGATIAALVILLLMAPTDSMPFIYFQF